MEELIKKNHIAVNVKADNWEEAIREVGKLLIDDNCIDEEYINNMVKSVKELGPYIILTKGFALAHAAPNEEIVHQTSVSLITLDKPVEFGSPNDPVGVVMCLACRDHSTHVDSLSNIAKKLMSDGFLNSVSNCTTLEELYRVVNN